MAHQLDKNALKKVAQIAQKDSLVFIEYGNNKVNAGNTLINYADLREQINEEITEFENLTITDTLTVEGGIEGNGTNIAGFYPTAAPQALSGAGAVNVTSYYTAWTTTSTDAATLTDGNQVGQLKKITLVVDGGDGTLTPTSFGTSSTITFDTAGNYVLLMWDGSDWIVLENNGTTIA